MNPDEELSRQFASSASQVAARLSSMSVDLLTDVTLFALQRSAALETCCAHRPRVSGGTRRTVSVLHRVARVAPPLAGRAAYASAYLGARGGFTILRQLNKTLSDAMTL
jgi:hypothetical protein